MLVIHYSSTTEPLNTRMTQTYTKYTIFIVNLVIMGVLFNYEVNYFGWNI